jgi:hypothetical protein
MAIKFRFSLRWLLITFTVLSVGFYLLFVHPTVLAKRRVAKLASESPDTGSDDSWVHIIGTEMLANRKSPLVKSTIEPQSWADLWHFKRRITSHRLTWNRNDTALENFEIEIGPFTDTSFVRSSLTSTVTARAGAELAK